MKKAVVLLSGGMDSAVTLYLARKKGYKTHCLIFDYGQRHKKEVLFAKRLARLLNSEYSVLDIELPWKKSALLDKRISVPEHRELYVRGHKTVPFRVRMERGRSVFRSKKPRALARGASFSRKKEIPPTYVPARNTIFISFALSLAEAIGAGVIFIGANAIDFSGYPDCRPIYFKKFNELLKKATKAKGIRIEEPLLYKTKKEIVNLGRKLGVRFDLTWSCYKGGQRPCGKCDACRLRAMGLGE